MILEILKKSNCEIIAMGPEPVLIEVKFIPFEDWPYKIKGLFEEALKKDIKAQHALTVLGITEKDDRIKKYAYCKNGGFDNKPDFSSENIHNPEYFNCELRSNCPAKAQKHLCGCYKATNGTLFPREIEVIKLIAEDLLDKQIADRLNVSVNTISSQRASVLKKIGAESKAGIAAFAIENGIIK